MAAKTFTTLTQPEREALASRLIDHADGITNAAAHEMEMDIRAAAAALQQDGKSVVPRALISSLRAELISIASATSDASAAERLRELCP